MAHKLAHDTESDGDDPPGNRPPRNTLERRQYVRFGGAAVATILSIVGAVPTAVATGAETDDAEHTLRIRGSGTASTYELTVDGKLAPGAESSSDAEARISDCTAEGAITTGDRRYRFSGELRDLQVDGDAAVTVDGVEVR